MSSEVWKYPAVSPLRDSYSLEGGGGRLTSHLLKCTKTLNVGITGLCSSVFVPGVDVTICINNCYILPYTR